MKNIQNMQANMQENMQENMQTICRQLELEYYYAKKLEYLKCAEYVYEKKICKTIFTKYVKKYVKYMQNYEVKHDMQSM